MAATLQFDFRMGPAAQRRDERTARLLLIGDFGARMHRGIADPASLARRPVFAVDVDSVAAAMARCAPQIVASLPNGTAVNLAFRSLDDLHPDRLVGQHAPLAALAAMRRRLLDPAQFAAAAAELGAIAGGRTNVPEDDRSALNRLLGGSPDKPVRGSAAAAAVQAFVRQIAAGGDHVPSLEFQPQYLAAVDMPAAAELRALLHAPAFQALEAAWRGVELLVSRLDFGDELELYLLDATLDELRADAAQAAGDAAQAAGDGARSGLARRLRGLQEEAADAGADWLLAGGLFGFGAADLDVLESVGAAALAAGIPFVAGADATIAGTSPDASEWRAPEPGDLARWQALRRNKAASAIGLVAPRLLLRLPYGAQTDSIDAFGFEELAAAPPQPGELLWGHGSLAALLVRAGGTDALDVDDLPALTFTADGERQLQPCAEWLIGERVADRMIDIGLMPLLASRHRNAVRLVGFRSIG